MRSKQSCHTVNAAMFFNHLRMGDQAMSLTHLRDQLDKYSMSIALDYLGSQLQAEGAVKRLLAMNSNFREVGFKQASIDCQLQGSRVPSLPSKLYTL